MRWRCERDASCSAQRARAAAADRAAVPSPRYASSMSAVARTKTFEELYREIQELPEGSRGEILTPGVVHITMGRPGKKHRRAAQVLYVGLASRDANVGGTGWWIELEP